jgi:hypothetical protein
VRLISRVLPGGEVRKGILSATRLPRIPGPVALRPTLTSGLLFRGTRADAGAGVPRRPVQGCRPAGDPEGELTGRDLRTRPYRNYGPSRGSCQIGSSRRVGSVRRGRLRRVYLPGPAAGPGAENCNFAPPRCNLCSPPARGSLPFSSRGGCAMVRPLARRQARAPGTMPPLTPSRARRRPGSAIADRPLSLSGRARTRTGPRGLTHLLTGAGHGPTPTPRRPAPLTESSTMRTEALLVAASLGTLLALAAGGAHAAPG